eukprot:7533250-Pyramimonas_sp.AAC.1
MSTWVHTCYVQRATGADYGEGFGVGSKLPLKDSREEPLLPAQHHLGEGSDSPVTETRPARSICAH